MPLLTVNPRGRFRAGKIELDPATQPLATHLHGLVVQNLRGREGDTAATLNGLAVIVANLIPMLAALEGQINRDDARPSFDTDRDLGPSGQYQVPKREIPTEMRNPLSVHLDDLEARVTRLERDNRERYSRAII